MCRKGILCQVSVIHGLKSVTTLSSFCYTWPEVCDYFVKFLPERLGVEH